MTDGQTEMTEQLYAMNSVDGTWMSLFQCDIDQLYRQIQTTLWQAKTVPICVRARTCCWMRDFSPVWNPRSSVTGCLYRYSMLYTILLLCQMPPK